MESCWVFSCRQLDSKETYLANILTGCYQVVYKRTLSNFASSVRCMFKLESLISNKWTAHYTHWDTTKFSHEVDSSVQSKPNVPSCISWIYSLNSYGYYICVQSHQCLALKKRAKLFIICIKGSVHPECHTCVVTNLQSWMFIRKLWQFKYFISCRLRLKEIERERERKLCWIHQNDYLSVVKFVVVIISWWLREREREYSKLTQNDYLSIQ